MTQAQQPGTQSEQAHGAPGGGSPSAAPEAPVAADRELGTIRRYAALGDSFTEGLMDPSPDGAPNRFLGWADRLALGLAESPVAGPELEYANLAVRGRLLERIIEEQVPAALELKPDLVSFVGGGNDCLRPGADIDGLAAQLERAIIALRAEGIQVLLGNGYDTQMFTPVLRALRPRVAIYNSHLWTIAHRHDCFMLDLWGLRRLYAKQMWAEDRIHLSSLGHATVAATALGVVEGSTPAGRGFRIPPAPARRVRQAVTEEAHWMRTHVGPWVSRRLHGTSSGDLLEPKYAGFVPVSRLPVPADPEAPGPS
ncbi:SGNH/GDSL hydrolase family protein [Brevibacterium sp. 5221]|uniref:SGNH/GDSL hydrolase family protein n=1 Tax=Brevibacterium rongguiense TaxID=2695267 RepID=A0A6N9H9G9_9MICO|nr:SGNH/GDSL hydrolase family protein [Brevibacterium rongguiense]MYM20663.1 SGNH/GDSL hydrolase family protein [Brevibacterium rongguiense]